MDEVKWSLVSPKKLLLVRDKKDSEYIHIYAKHAFGEYYFVCTLYEDILRDVIYGDFKLDDELEIYLKFGFRKERK